MRFASGLVIPVVGAIIASWWWLGTPVAMPPSPLAPGEKLYCVSYTPFRDWQTPLDRTTWIDPSQIDDDLSRLAKLTDCVRTYSTDLGLDQVPEIAQRHGLKVLLGLWLGHEPGRNRREIETVVALAQRFPDVLRAIVVGNETLLRGEIAAADLVKIIREVKTRTSVPVTYADVWEFWLRNREIYDAVDFVTIHVLPYWEDFPISARDAAAHVDSIHQEVAEAFPGKEILLGEVGWPSAGRMREGALPSPANQARVIHEVLTLAKRRNYRVNVIEAFDQPWKRAQEGTTGGHWGFLDAETRKFKFHWGEPVSNHPGWRWQAALGAALAIAVYGAAAIGLRRRPATAKSHVRATWIGLPLIALIPGVLVGWVVADVPVQSLGVGGWTSSLIMAGLAITVPVLSALALVRGTTIPGLSRILGGAADRPRDPLTLALGVLLILLCVISLDVALGLVFNPRYLDFPFAPLTAAVLPVLIVVWMARSGAGRLGLAEIVAAAVLAGSAIYIALNESFANWQSLWLCAALLALVVTLLRLRGGPGSK